MAGGANPYFYNGTGDGSQATKAGLADPCYDVGVDGAGNLYIAAGTLIRKVDSSGVISTIAGGGTGVDDGIAATDAEIAPIAIAVDVAGYVFIADTAFGNTRIRLVNPQGTIGNDRGRRRAVLRAAMAVPLSVPISACLTALRWTPRAICTSRRRTAATT